MNGTEGLHGVAHEGADARSVGAVQGAEEQPVRMALGQVTDFRGLVAGEGGHPEAVLQAEGGQGQAEPPRAAREDDAVRHLPSLP